MSKSDKEIWQSAALSAACDVTDEEGDTWDQATQAADAAVFTYANLRLKQFLHAVYTNRAAMADPDILRTATPIMNMLIASGGGPEEQPAEVETQIHPDQGKLC